MLSAKLSLPLDPLCGCRMHIALWTSFIRTPDTCGRVCGGSLPTPPAKIIASKNWHSQRSCLDVCFCTLNSGVITVFLATSTVFTLQPKWSKNASLAFYQSKSACLLLLQNPEGPRRIAVVSCCNRIPVLKKNIYTFILYLIFSTFTDLPVSHLCNSLVVSPVLAGWRLSVFVQHNP